MGTARAAPLGRSDPERTQSAEDHGPSEARERYKAPDAGTSDEASEVNQALGATSVADSWSKLDTDFQWAYAVASFAEILKDSPYATKGAINTIGNIIGQPAHDGVAEREQFRSSFATAKTLLQ